MRLQLINILFGSILLVSQFAFADFKVEDPQGVLTRLNQYGQNPSFEQAFKCGQSEQFYANTEYCDVTCPSFYCMSKCVSPGAAPLVSFELFVEECNSERVMVYGDNGLSIEVTREDYIKGGNTWLIPLLKGLHQFIRPEGRIVVSSSFPTSVNYAKDGVNKRVSGVRISTNVFTDNPRKSELVEIIYSNHFGNGLSQILNLNMGMGQDTFMVLYGVQSGR